MTRGCTAVVLFERDGELAVVGGSLRRAAAGAGSVVVVTGPLGNGKTALLRALAHHPQARGFAVLRASASLVERDFPQGVVLQLREDGVDLGDDLPLLVLVDDLQWADDESLVALERLAARAAHRLVVLVVAVREGDPCADRPGVVSIVAGATRRIRPKPLLLNGSAALLRSRLGRACDDEFVLACREVTGGNPMLLTALALAWSAGGLPPVAANAGAVRAMPPTWARDRLVACVRTQDEPARAMLRALAVLGSGLSDAAALAGLDRATARHVTRSLRRLGLLSTSGFAHPGVRAAVEETMTARELEETQIRSARFLHDSGRPAEEVAHQLLGITRPLGPWVVEVLRVAADTALRSGSPESAARWLRRALLDTSADGEDRAKVLVDLATAVRGFDVQAAVRSISYAVPLLREPRDRAAALIRLTPAVMGNAPEAVLSLLRRAGAELGDPAGLDPVGRELALRVEARVRYAGSTERAELARAAARLTGIGPDAPMSTGAERELLAVLLHSATISVGKPADEVAVLAARLLDHEPAFSPHSLSCAPLLVSCLAAADAPGVTTRWLDQALETARSRGDSADEAMIRSEQALAHLVSGQVEAATLAAADAVALGAGDRSAVGTSAAVVLAGVALQLRDPVLTDQALNFAVTVPVDDCLSAVMGLLQASSAALRGDLPGAAMTLMECGVRLDRSGWRNPVLYPWRSALALIKNRLGETEEAIALAEEERLIAQDWGAPSGVGRAWRVLGAVTGGAPGTEMTCRAVEVLEESAHALELVLAVRQLARLTGHEDLWRRCLGIAEEIGADIIAAQARTALGGETRTGEGTRLTPSERRVAQLAADGRSNQEIADELAVTPRTVEKHLTNTYRKLGVSRRTELAAALRRVAADPA
ncbi:LuxR C-terminal-related transcriptional regulator [Lentzea sp. NPDC004789]